MVAKAVVLIEELSRMADDENRFTPRERKILLDAAITLLLTDKRHARLLTLKEIKALSDHTVIWEEVRIDWSNNPIDSLRENKIDIDIAPVEKAGNVIHSESMDTPIDDKLLATDDGVTCRYWSARPTKEQREAEAWNV